MVCTRRSRAMTSLRADKDKGGGHWRTGTTEAGSRGHRCLSAEADGVVREAATCTDGEKNRHRMELLTRDRGHGIIQQWVLLGQRCLAQLSCHSDIPAT